MIVLPALPSCSFKPGLLRMPVRVEERVNRSGAGQARDDLHDHVSRPRRSAIDEQHAVRASLRDDVRLAGDADDEEIVAEALDVDAGERRLHLRAKPPNRRTQGDPGGTRQCRRY